TAGGDGSFPSPLAFFVADWGTMELAPFIATHREKILEAWETDARSRVPQDRRMSLGDLRDHLGELLATVADDLSGAAKDRVQAVAEKHGCTGAAQGLTINEVIAEFPILRACVARLWLESLPASAAADVQPLVHFDEAVDRALRESVIEFMGRLDQSRETFLGILGHDLRDPLATVIARTTLLLEENLDEGG